MKVKLKNKKKHKSKLVLEKKNIIKIKLANESKHKIELKLEKKK